MKNVMSLPNCIINPLHAKAVTKVVNPTSTPSHCSRLLGYDHRILPFVDVEAKECIEHVSDKEEEGMEDYMGSYGACMHDSTLTTLNVLITLWTSIRVSNFLLYFHLCPKIQVLSFPQCLHKFIPQTYMNSIIIV